MPGRGRKPSLQTQRNNALSLLDMSSALSEALKQQASEPNLFGYVPHQKQLDFHRSDTFGRLFIGGNRSGKTVCGIVEDLWWVTRRHPYRTIPSDVAIRGRAVSVDFVAGVEGILLPVLKRWVIPSDLVNGSWEDSWDKMGRTLTFANKSFIEFRTYDQDLEKHAGTSRHFVHFDEEPPEAIFNENKLRLLDTGGKYWITMTPVNGMTWVYDRLIEPEAGHSVNLTIIEVDTDENPHLSEEAKAEVFDGMSEDDIKARKKGQWVTKGGLVYPEFQESIHATLPATWLPPRDWTIWTSIDHGVNNPTAIGYHGVSPDGLSVVTFHEFYESNKLVKDHAATMHAYEKEIGIAKRIYLRTGDPAMKQRNGITGTSIIDEYRDHDIVLAVDSVPKDVMIGVTKIRQYLRINPKTGRPFWQMTDNCKWHRTQFKRLSWETYKSAKMNDNNNKMERIKKKDDHTCDETRYFFTCLPDLSKEVFEPTAPQIQKAAVDSEYIQTLIQMSVAPEDSYRPPPGSLHWETEVGFDLDSREDLF